MRLRRRRDALIYIPQSYRPGTPAPLVLALHGAGGDANSGIRWLLPLADEAGTVLVAPASAGRTWDVIVGGFGPDVAFIDEALAAVFFRYAIDAARIAAQGFSDGASYALSIGVTNGDLFSHVIAFSPGFMAPGPIHGKPAVFISHGTQDTVLPIDVTSRRLVPKLERAHYDVTYEEHPGGHGVPPEIAQEGLDWFLA